MRSESKIMLMKHHEQGVIHKLNLVTLNCCNFFFLLKKIIFEKSNWLHKLSYKFSDIWSLFGLKLPWKCTIICDPPLEKLKNFQKLIFLVDSEAVLFLSY